MTATTAPEGAAVEVAPSGSLTTYNRADYDVPTDGNGRWIDAGQWRDKGITHWHLVISEWNVNDTSRFDNDRANAERNRPTHGSAWSPHEVADWKIDQTARLAKDHGLTDEQLISSGLATDEDWHLKEEVIFRAAMFGNDTCGNLALRGGRIAHINAYACTGTRCCQPPE